MTRKEYEAVKLLSRGRTAPEIARELGVTESSINSRIKRCRVRFCCLTNYHLFYRLGIAAGHNLPVRFIAEEEPTSG